MKQVGSIMQEHLNSRDRHEMLSRGNYYETGISKFARMRKDNNQRSVVQDIADGIGLAKSREEMREFFKR
jgi:DnaJ-domain-containing protein 1|tara:strand:+ start:119 stop:328 length:210 start_codon:yes stop_codon:yes gene_type:complete